MSKCDRYLPDLSAWVDGELEDSRELEAHLAECASCRAKAAAYRRLDLQIANVVPPKNLHSHIMAGIDGSLSKKKRLRAPWKGALATAAALLVVLGAGLLTRPYWGSSSAALDAANQTAMELDAPAASPAAADTAAETTVTTATILWRRRRPWMRALPRSLHPSPRQTAAKRQKTQLGLPPRWRRKNLR